MTDGEKGLTNVQKSGIILSGGGKMIDEKNYDKIYEEAKGGGRHGGWYDTSLKKSNVQ